MLSLRTISFSLSAITFFLFLSVKPGNGSPDEYRLLQDLFYRRDGGYNPLIRPVKNLSDIITVGIEMALIQLINLDEKNQIMKSNVWLRLRWCDRQLTWQPKEYGDIAWLRIQPDRVWKPDIVLFNNADGRFEVSFKANVVIQNNGFVMWIPCTIYKSSCTIDVTYFPFDEQICDMIFGSWTYNADEVRLTWYLPYPSNYSLVDISDYESSGTWDLVGIPGQVTTKGHEDEDHSKSFVTYQLKLRRKTLFYAVNLIIPCLLISILSMVVFYLPSDAGEKTTTSVSILLALVVFLQVLVTNLLPPSSTSFPLFAKYLLFAVVLDVCCIVNTIFVLNWNFKTPRTHRMARWIRTVFFGFLPRILLMKRPSNDPAPAAESLSFSRCSSTPMNTPEPTRRAAIKPQEFDLSDMHHNNCPLRRGARNTDAMSTVQLTAEVNKAVEAVRFISAHLKNEDDYDEVLDDWRYIALVIDRLLFYIYAITTVGTALAILTQAPHIFESFSQDHYKQKYTEIHKKGIEATLHDFYSCPNV